MKVLDGETFGGNSVLTSFQYLRIQPYNILSRRNCRFRLNAPYLPDLPSVLKLAGEGRGSPTLFN